MVIPVVDFADYALSVPADQADVQKLRGIADELRKAFTTVGFVYLKNHGLPEYVIENTFAISKTFFEKPVEIKQKYERPADDNHGWVALERENLNPERPAADLKEAYNMTLVDDQGDQTYLRQCHQKMGKRGNATTLRSLFYPPITKGVKTGQVRCGEHSDYGSITLLFQDDIGGLEVKPTGYDYVPASPIHGTVLVNLGDLMQRWTADKLIATKHRVLIPEKEVTQKKGRQSLAFFVHPDDEVMIKCLDGSGKYEEMSSIDYLNMRFAATYLERKT